MVYEVATALLQCQERELKKLDGWKLNSDRYEYRLRYESGFAPMVWIDRREKGKRNFREIDGVPVYKCATTNDAMRLVIDKIKTMEKGG